MKIQERYDLFTGSLLSIAGSIQTIRTRVLRRFHLRGSSLNTLVQLCRHPEGATVTELSGLCGEDKASISRSVRELTEQGYARGRGESSRYRAKIMLTPRGQEVGCLACREIAQAVETCGGALDEDQRKIFYSCLGEIRSELSRIAEETT